MKHFLLAGLLILTVVNPSIAEEEAGTARVLLQDPRLILEKDKQPAPSLIPTRLLEIPYEQWSSDNRSRASRQYFEKFNTMIENVRTLGTSGACTPGKGFPEKSSIPKPGERRFSILEVAGNNKSVLIGEVVATEPAWSLETGQIYTLVHLKVQRIVRGLDNLAVGEVVTYRRPWGTATLRGITLCSYANGLSPLPPRPGRDAPERLRPTFLIVGRIVPGNGLFLDTSDYEEFQIVDGWAHYPPGISIFHENKPENLETLLSHFQGISQ